MFELKTAFEILLMIAGASLALVVHNNKESISEVKKEIMHMKNDHQAHALIVADLREDIPRRYATIEDLDKSVRRFDDTVERVFSSLARIEDRINHINRTGK